MVDACRDLQAVELICLLVLGEHETEIQVLVVGHALGREHKAAVELAHALVHLAVGGEKLQLHRVLLFGGARRDHVVDLHVGGRVIEIGHRLGVRSLVLDRCGDAESGQLANHI